MAKRKARMIWSAMVLIGALGWGIGIHAAAPESKRLTRARDYIADEQWAMAIEVLRAAVKDSKEPRRDEAFYWLAHSLDQSGDPGEAVQTVSRLEQEFPGSMWVRPAQSLRIAIAVRLQRRDVLWFTAMSPPKPAELPGPRKGPRPAPPPPPAVGATPVPAPAPAIKARPPMSPPPPMWYSDVVGPDVDLKIQALGGLMKVEPEKVVPILSQFAFDAEDGPAMRAVFILSQSPLPKARETVVKVAKTAPEPLRIAAVRDLGRFGGPEISDDLLDVYVTANEPVRSQIIKAFGERAESKPLMSILDSETNGKLRSAVIVSLGQAGQVVQLAKMYPAATIEMRRSIIDGLFFARAEGELIRIADIEKTGNVLLRRTAVERLRLLATPKAKEYLLKVSEKR